MEMFLLHDASEVVQWQRCSLVALAPPSRSSVVMPGQTEERRLPLQQV